MKLICEQCAKEIQDYRRDGFLMTDHDTGDRLCNTCYGERHGKHFGSIAQQLRNLEEQRKAS